jgi:hypothetical protein
MTVDTGLNKPEISVQIDLWEDLETSSVEDMTSWPSIYKAEVANPVTLRKLNEMGTRATHVFVDSGTRNHVTVIRR